MEYKKTYKEAEKAGQVENLTPEFKKFNQPGERIIGQLKAIAPVSSSLGEGEYNQYLVHTDDGLVKFRMGSASDKELVPLLVIGKMYCFEFVDKVQISGGRSVNKFKVWAFGDPGKKVGEEDDTPF